MGEKSYMVTPLTKNFFKTSYTPNNNLELNLKFLGISVSVLEMVQVFKNQIWNALFSPKGNIFHLLFSCSMSSSPTPHHVRGLATLLCLPVQRLSRLGVPTTWRLRGAACVQSDVLGVLNGKWCARRGEIITYATQRKEVCIAPRCQRRAVFVWEAHYNFKG